MTTTRKEFLGALALAGSALALGAAEPAKKPGLRIGIIGCDTSHAPAFTGMLNAKKPDPIFNGARVTCAYKWGSRDLACALTRYEKFIGQMKRSGVKMVDSIPELLAQCDAVCIETVDGRPHLAEAREVFASGKPCFIDKPIAASLADAIKIVEEGRRTKAKWFCSSSLRYLPRLAAVRAGEFGRVRGADCWSPTTFEPTHSEFFWYAIHAAEPLFAMMGTGCKEVRCTGTETEDVAIGTWTDGRLGVMRALNYSRSGSCYGGTAFCEGKGKKIRGGAVDLGTYNGYRDLLVEIVRFFETGVPPVSAEETLEIYTFLEAAAQSKRRGGAVVTLAEVLAAAKR